MNEINPVCYIVRGLPGSGKTTLAKKLVHLKYHFEADKYFINDKGEYKFEPKNIEKAHEWCLECARIVMEKNRSNIAISNTFIKYWEYKKYIQIAKENNYKVQVISCHGEWENIHGVPHGRIKRMKERWEDHIDK